MSTNIETRKLETSSYLQENVLNTKSSLATIVVNVSNKCNLKCAFCPQGNPDFTSPNKPDFINISIIEELAKQTKNNFLGIFSISGFGEPLLHPEIEKIISILNPIGNGVTLYSNGVLKDKIKYIKSNKLKISLYTKEIDAYYTKNINTLSAKKIILNRQYKENNTFFNNKAGNVKYYDKNNIPMNCCYIPFMKITLDTDGTLLQCCSDWSRKFPLGNIQKDNLWDIWNGELEKRERLHLIANERNKCVLCKTCNSPGNLYGEEFKNFWEEYYGKRQ